MNCGVEPDGTIAARPLAHVMGEDESAPQRPHPNPLETRNEQAN
jgi:hypothetical protein